MLGRFNWPVGFDLGKSLTRFSPGLSRMDGRGLVVQLVCFLDKKGLACFCVCLSRTDGRVLIGLGLFFSLRKGFTCLRVYLGGLFRFQLFNSSVFWRGGGQGQGLACFSVYVERRRVGSGCLIGLLRSVESVGSVLDVGVLTVSWRAICRLGWFVAF